MVVERYSYGLYGDPDTEAFVDTARTNLLVSQDAIDKHAEVFSWSIDYIGTDGLRGDLRADVDGDGIISSWDQLRFAQQQTAWTLINIDQIAANSDEAIDGWSTVGQLSRPHPVGMKPTGEPLDAGTPSQPFHREQYKLRGVVQLDNRLGYAGYVWDPFLQMYHVRHRVLNPRLGIWMQPDPIGYAGGWNLHEYCGGDPLGFVDPTGETPVQLGGALAGFFIGGGLSLAMSWLEHGSLDNDALKRAGAAALGGAVAGLTFGFGHSIGFAHYGLVGWSALSSLAGEAVTIFREALSGVLRGDVRTRMLFAGVGGALAGPVIKFVGTLAKELGDKAIKMVSSVAGDVAELLGGASLKHVVMELVDSGVNNVRGVFQRLKALFGVEKPNAPPHEKTTPAGASCSGAEASGRIKANKAAGDAIRDAIAAREAPAIVEQTFHTIGGVRRVDVLKLGEHTIAIESKVGRTNLDTRVRQELARDWWLRRQGQVDQIRWEFSRSHVTGEIGPTTPLLEKLLKLGFDIKVNR